MPERWTRGVLRLRVPILSCWLAVVVVGVLAAIHLTPLLSNTFSVPGTASDRAGLILTDAFGEQPDGVFTVVFRVGRPFDRVARTQLERRLVAAASTVPTAHATALLPGGGVLYGAIDTTLDLAHAQRYTTTLRRALSGSPPALVTGLPAIQHDLEPILSSDLRRGEAIALPIALLVLLAVFGLSPVIVIPFVFASCTIAGTLVAVYAAARLFSMVSYVMNVVELIGIGLAVDYSLLVVYRFRQELVRDEGSVEDAVVRTMATAGRTIVVSGVTVAIGLALLLFVPVPFLRSLGVAGFLVPLASIAAATSLQPALLSLVGRRAAYRVPVAALIRSRLGIRLPVLPTSIEVDGGFWEQLARTINRRPVAFAAAGVVVLLAAATPALLLQVTPGTLSVLPRELESVQGLRLLHDRVGAGALTPMEVVVDARASGQALSKPVHAAVLRLTDEIYHDPEAYVTVTGPGPPFVDPSGRYARVLVLGRHEYGDEATQAFVHRLRATFVPAAGFPAGVRVYVGGAPAEGVDFLSRSYGWLPWLVLGTLALTALILLRAFRSLVLPLEAVILNLLSVAAVYGLLVVVFRFGVGADLLGLSQVSQIEGWIPIFLFTVLFGLSMDYEVFLVMRMRESWDESHDNAHAVAYGLSRTGPVVTAAAVIMIGAFSGFAAGRVAGLQEFGVGLVLAVLVDATVIRACLLPALMTILNRYNWWLPQRIARLARVQATPLGT